MLYYAQQLANHLITKCAVQSGDIICQLMERSFEMVIGMMGIWISGGIYAPLNLHDPLQRINLCLQQIDPHIILVHQSTNTQLLPECLLINVDQVLSSLKCTKRQKHVSSL